jgi:hypothetical protein
MFYILTESGGKVLLEDGSGILLENQQRCPSILLESGGHMLTEAAGYVCLEGQMVSSVIDGMIVGIARLLGRHHT